MLRPTFSLSAGSLQSTSARPVGGPLELIVERDMDVPADVLRATLSDRSGVALGDAVSLSLGHDDSNDDVFTGTVAALRPSIEAVTIVALGSMNALLNLRVAKSWTGQAAGAVASDLIGQAGLSAGTVDDGPTLPIYAIDSRISAFAHLRDLADRLGYELYAGRDGKIHFHALGAAGALDSLGGLLGAAAGAAAALGLGGGGEGYAYGKHLLSASARVRTAAWGTVEVGGESPMSSQGDSTSHWLTKDDSSFRGSAGSGDPTLLVLDAAARTKDLADRFAAGRLATAGRDAWRIEVTVLGRPGLDLGDSFTSSDVPDALVDGSGYVRSLRHRFGPAGFVTDLHVAGSPP